MATAAFPDEVSGDSLECTICCYTFKNPKVLPCLHTFCEHCLREWVQKNDGDTFPCPICRQPVPLPQDGVEGLKDNVFLASLVKAVTEHNKIRQGKDDLLCTNCDEGKPATSRCSECAEFLCESCESAHRLLRATKGHTLFTFEELKTGKYDKVFRARTAPPCSKHSGEILKVYCRTCETPICNECALFEHRDSQHDFSRLEEVAVEKRETILDLTPRCQAPMQFFRQTEEVQKRLKEQLQLNAEGARQNVHKTVQILIALVKEEGERLLTCVDAEEKTRKKQIDAEIEAAQISLTSAKSTCEFAETLAREGGDYEVVSFSQDMTTRLDDLTKPPADTVDFELANITVDYSVMEHKLTTNSPKSAQYSLPKQTERELCSLLKRVPQNRTSFWTGLPLGPSRTSESGNASRNVHVLSDDDSNDDPNKDKQNKLGHEGHSAENGPRSSGPEQEKNSPFELFDTEATQSRGSKKQKDLAFYKENLCKNSMQVDHLSSGATGATFSPPTDKEHKAGSASRTGSCQEDSSPFEVFIDPDILTYMRQNHHAEITDIGRRYKSMFHTSLDNTKASFVPSLFVGKNPEPEKAIDEFTALYQQVFHKVTCENFNVAQYYLAPTFLLDGVRKMRQLHPDVLTKATDNDTTVMFIGEPKKIKAARTDFCGLMGISISRNSRRRGNRPPTSTESAGGSTDAPKGAEGGENSPEPVLLYTHTFEQGVEVKVAHGNITTLNVDAIVNAADARLQHGGGVAKAIVEAGGYIIQEESTEKMKTRGWLKPSETEITGAGSLPCKNIIHAHGPKWQGANQAKWCTEMLTRTCINILHAAEGLKAESVAIPAISSGKYGMPKQDCAQALLSGVLQYLSTKRAPSCSPRTIWFIDMTEDIVQVLADVFAAKIFMLQSPRSGVDCLLIQGVIHDVTEVMKKIWTVLNAKVAEQRDLEKAHSVQKDAQWSYVVAQGREQKIHPNANAKIEAAYKAKKSSVKYDDDNEDCEIDFKAMRVTMKPSKRSFPVQRRDKRAEVVTSAVPSHWDPQPTDPKSKKPKLCHLVKLKSSSTEYNTVSRKFGLGNIMSIERVQNPTLWNQYCAQKQKISQKNPGQNVEQELWHGSSSDSCVKIYTNGFNRSYAGLGSIGKGTYFAVNSSYSAGGYASPDASGHKRLFLAKVLTGLSTPGNPSMNMPPARPGGGPLDTYDSTSGGNIFCVFHDAQAYPEYLITFT